MNITENTTLKAILDERPDAIEVFLKHGVDVSSECDESVHDCELTICEGMCHIDALDDLIKDLQEFFAKGPVVST
ncbi:MAG: hypothetical protein K2Y39_03610 [Candidatus Obscuribacterales bacterium]|nr:hypothetical protein [Candidatus Obscuribacterales bacterium]HNB21813.1 hypothetical protein [Candidatus Melainabacteria bacterium]